jgi:acetyl-CoA acyltransferase 1
MERLQNLQSHLTKGEIANKNPNDVVICSAVRTPLTKAKKGGLKDTAPEYLLSVVLREAARRAKVDTKLV